MFYKFEIFFSFPLTATFGKKDYKVNECGTKQPCLLVLFYLFFSIRTMCTSIYEFWNCIYTKQLLFGEMITKPKYFFISEIIIVWKLRYNSGMGDTKEEKSSSPFI